MLIVYTHHRDKSMIWPVISTSNSRHLNELFSSLKCPENFWAISTAKLEQNQLNLSTIEVLNVKNILARIWVLGPNHAQMTKVNCIG